MACNLIITYKTNNGEEVSRIIPTNLTSYTSTSPEQVMEFINDLSESDLDSLDLELSSLTLSGNRITYSNGDKVIGNSTLDSIADLVDSVRDRELVNDFYALRDKLSLLGVSSSDIQILLLEGEDINLTVDGQSGSIRGALLENNLIILNTPGIFNDDSLKDLYHEMLHFYFKLLPKSGGNFDRINEIAYNIYKSAQNNKDKNVYIKEFVTKVTNESGHYNLTELISYLLSEPKYREVLNLDNSKEYKEFVDRIFSADLNINLLTREVVPENIRVTTVLDNTDSTDSTDNTSPFVGKDDISYTIPDVDKRSSESIYKTFTSSVLDSKKFGINDKLGVNYSEIIPINSELQLFSLTPGDLILIPSYRYKDGNIIYGDFDNKYFSNSKYFPVQSVWRNSYGSVMITFVGENKNGPTSFTIQYSDLLRLYNEKNITPQYRKYYGELNSLSSNEHIKSVGKRYETELSKNTSPIIKATISIQDGVDVDYYTVGENGFKVTISNGAQYSPNILQELRQGDIIKLNSNDELSSYAPVVRVLGTNVEVAIKENGEYVSKLINFNNIDSVVYSKLNHPDIVSLYNLWTNNYNTYKRHLSNKSKYYTLWNSSNNSSVDKESALRETRLRTYNLNFGDSISLRNENGVSQHLVIGVDGDYITYLTKGSGSLDSVSVLDIKDSKTYPILEGFHYNNINDIELVNNLNDIKDSINKQFEYWSNNSEFEAGTEFKSLHDLYNIINIDSTNYDEAAKLQRGDIIKFTDNGLSYIGVVSKFDPITGIIQVPGAYKTGKYPGKTYRKLVNLNQIEYIGFALNTNLELGILGHFEIVEYNNKRKGRLYHLNHNTFGYTLEQAIEKKNKLNKTKDWVTEAEAVYVVPKTSYISGSEFDYLYNSKVKSVKNGRTVLLSPLVINLINSGDLIDLTSEYIKANSLNTDKLYTLRNIKTGIALNDTSGYNQDTYFYKRNLSQLSSIIRQNDVIKLKYGESPVKYTKYLRVKHVTDKGITLESDVLGLSGKLYHSNWYIKYSNIESGKYTITEFLYPYNKQRTKELNDLPFNETLTTPKDSKSFTNKMNAQTSAVILNRVISNLNSLYNNIINKIDSSQINDWLESGVITNELANNLSNSGAFILDNKIYVNTSKANASSPIHELLHMTMGIMRTSTPNLYYSLIDKVSTLPEFKDLYRIILTNRTMSDAKEETFVEVVAKGLTGVLSQDMGRLNNILKETNFFNSYLNIIDTAFGLDLKESDAVTSEVLSKDISDMSLEEVVKGFNSLLLTASDPEFGFLSETNLSKAFKNRNITNIKSSLLNSKDSNGKLIEQC